MSRRKNPRRIFNRCNVELPVGFWSLNETDTPAEYMKGETVDLSEGGLLLRCDRFEDGFLEALAEADSQFAMRIHLTGQTDWVRATAKVVWIEEENNKLLVRACFVDMDDESAAKIQDVVAQGAVELRSLG